MSDFEPIDLDWSVPAMQPGIRIATVQTIDQARSKKNGDRMFKVKLRTDDEPDAPAVTVFDVIMLEGPGKGMGIARLKALGAEEGKPIVPADLVGRRVRVELVVGMDQNGADQLKVKKYLPLGPGESERVPDTHPDEAPW